LRRLRELVPAVVAAAVLVVAGAALLAHRPGEAGRPTHATARRLVIPTGNSPPPPPDLAVSPNQKPLAPLGSAPGAPDPTPGTGIVTTRVQPPFSAMEFTVRNEWIGPLVSGRALEIYAGGERVDPGGGPDVEPAVRAYVLTRDQGGHDSLAPAGTYVDSSASGPLSVTSVSGQTMSLRTDGGQSVAFDMQTMTFH
jgi:hypothetical protein